MSAGTLAGAKKGFLLIYLAVFLLALNPLFAKLIQLPATSIILARVFVAALALGAFSLFQKEANYQGFGTDRTRVLWICLLSACNFVCFYQSVQVSSVGIGISILMTHPVMTAILEPLFHKTPFNIRQLGYGAVIVIAVMILSDIDLSVGSAIQGVLWGLVSAFCFGCRNILLVPLTKRYPARYLMGAQLWVTFLVLLPFYKPLLTATMMDWVYIVIVGILGTAAAHTLIVKSIEYLPATTSGIISTVQVPIAILFAWVVLGEPVNRVVIGAAALIMGVAILEKIDHAKLRPKLN